VDKIALKQVFSQSNSVFPCVQHSNMLYSWSVVIL
jgi:hypothetical protein